MRIGFIFKCSILLLIFQPLNAQNKLDSIFSVQEEYRYEHFKNEKFKLSEKLELSNEFSKEYESQAEYYSTYIILYENSEYIYYSIFEGGFNVSFGTWKKLNDKQISLSWDKEKTILNYRDKDLISKIYKYSYPTPLKMTNWVLNIES